MLKKVKVIKSERTVARVGNLLERAVRGAVGHNEAYEVVVVKYRKEWRRILVIPKDASYITSVITQSVIDAVKPIISDYSLGQCFFGIENYEREENGEKVIYPALSVFVGI